MMMFLETLRKFGDCCKSLMVLSDYNARHRLCQYNEDSNHRNPPYNFLASTQSILVVTPDIPTFLQVNANSAIDLVFFPSKLKVKLIRQYLDVEVEIFTGAPRRGHVQILSTVNLRAPKTKILQKPDISRVEWDDSKVKLETKAADMLPLLETKTDLWDMTKELLNDAQGELMTTKWCCRQSKHF